MFRVNFSPCRLALLVIILVIILPLFLKTRLAFGRRHCERQSNCGVLLEIESPFRFQGDSKRCGHRDYELSCEHNRTVLHLESNKYYVQAITYGNNTIRVTDPGLQKGNCSTLPQYSFTANYYRPFLYKISSPIIFVSCENPVKSHFFVETGSCITVQDFWDSFFRPGEGQSYTYAVIASNLVASDIPDSCSIYKTIPSGLQFVSNTTRRISFQDIHNEMALGFELAWGYNMPFLFSSIYVETFISGIILVMFIVARTFVGVILLSIFLIYKCQRRHLSIYDAIEEFLQTSNNLMPIRYSYGEIKKMTSNFKEKLGKGGYGDVYKGKLRSGNLVAVKLLNEAKGNGQDFINEVATIGRIHHVNVVRLVGFCATASKRALVYDYMPNGSLDKFIFSDDPDGMTLSWNKAYEIAVGVARGIEYLHQGCNMQILHFDIKPHNILLDQNFVPKVSDFGLAKLYPRQNRFATVTAVRGTLGYMAPELFYKKIGGISYKADVYSFGQLLLAIAGRRKVNAQADHSSQVYFPSWIYDRLDRGEDLNLGDTTEEENKIVRKIVLVALWCVQWIPADRPAMRQVLEMLDVDLEGLQFPPKPVYYPPESSTQELSSSQYTEGSDAPLCQSITLEIEENH